MAQMHYEAYHAPQQDRTPPHEPHRVGRFVNLVGAAMSIALVVGVGIWGYRLTVRDVAGFDAQLSRRFDEAQILFGRQLIRAWQ